LKQATVNDSYIHKHPLTTDETSGGLN